MKQSWRHVHNLKIWQERSYLTTVWKGHRVYCSGQFDWVKLGGLFYHWSFFMAPFKLHLLPQAAQLDFQFYLVSSQELRCVLIEGPYL